MFNRSLIGAMTLAADQPPPSLKYFEQSQR
jgi:hypothetical protein